MSTAESSKTTTSTRPSRLAERRPGADALPRVVHSVTVIGAGVMGRGIAAANAAHGIEVTLSDTSDEALAAATRELSVDFGDGAVRASQRPEELAKADIVIEAVIERLPVKQRIFKKLEPLAGAQTILASNTSSIPITQLAAKLAQPERFVGLHFCHPVAERPLLEIVRGARTSDDTIARAVDYAGRIGKRPVVVRDSPGFVVNRLLTPYLNEALELLLEGATIEEVDAAAVAFGMPVGPLAAIDAIGIDVALRAGTIIYEAFPERIVPAALLVELFQQGQLGQKGGGGFYTYESGLRQRVSPVAATLIDDRRRDARSFSRDEITARLILPMLTEAALALDEQLVDRPGDIDEALVYGIGFPAKTGGLFRWADAVGMPAILDMLGPLQALGPRFQPSPCWTHMAASGSGFYG